MKTTNLFIVALCLTGLTAPAAAQGSKTLPAAARAIMEKTPKRIQGPKRFVFPTEFRLPATQNPYTLTQLNEALQRNIAQTQLAVATGATPPNLPWFHALWQGSPEKTFLDLSAQENKFYQQEMFEAKTLLSQIQLLQKFVLEHTSQQIQPETSLLVNITKNIVKIKNDYLRNMLLSMWEEGSLEAIQIELIQYFSLGIPFEDAAFNYSLRHPYNRNLQTTRLLHNPFIDKKFKEPVEAFVNKPIISLADKETFKAALRNLQAEYDRIRQEATQTLGVQVHIDHYKQIIGDLRLFIQKKNRRPKWNTRDAAEQELNFCIENIFYHEQQFNFAPFAEYHQQLHDLWDKYEPQFWTQEQTLQAFEKFMQHAPEGRVRPRAMNDAENIPPEEELLHDNLMHWYVKDSSFSGRIDKIAAKYQR